MEGREWDIDGRELKEWIQRLV